MKYVYHMQKFPSIHVFVVYFVYVVFLCSIR